MYCILSFYECVDLVCIVVKANLRFLLFQSHLFSKVNIPASGILTIDSSLPVNDCAEDYERKLKEVKPSSIKG